MSRHKQMGRILRIAALIHTNPRRFTRRRLAERCGVSLRTIQRDIEELNATGIRIDARPGGYEIISEYFLPPVNLTLEEALALVANSYYGIGKDRCRNYQRILSVNSFRFLMASARTLWFIQTMSHKKGLNWRRFRPWYRQKEKPSQRDVIMAYRETFAYEGISPTIRFRQDMPEIYTEQETKLHEVA